MVFGGADLFFGADAGLYTCDTLACRSSLVLNCRTGTCHLLYSVELGAWLMISSWDLTPRLGNWLAAEQYGHVWMLVRGKMDEWIASFVLVETSNDILSIQLHLLGSQ
jgi:hypothetical protein